MLLVVGNEERDAQAVNIRNRDDEVQGREQVIKVDVALEKLKHLRDTRAVSSKLN